MYERLNRGNKYHPGRASVRTALDAFKVSGLGSRRRASVYFHTPLWDSLRTFIARNPVGRLPVEILHSVLIRLFEALDYIHTEYHIIHTGNESPLIS